MAGKRCFAIIFRPIPILLAAFLFLNFLAKPDAPDGHSHSAYLDDGDGRVRVYKPSNSSSNVAICLIVKNETLYLDEWIDYQVALGFSPIYIYDNSPDFELKDRLHSGVYSWYETREDIHEYIRLIHFPGEAKQTEAYDQCIHKDAANSTFAALFDADEFVVLKTFDNIVDFMDHHCPAERCGQLSLNWRIMGTSGEQKYTAQPVSKRNVHWSPYEAKQGTIKVIVRPDYVSDDMRWSHSVVLKRGAWLDTNGKVQRQKGWKRMTNDDNPTDVAILYHYAFKSEAEFHHKTCVKTRAANKGTVCNSKMYYGIYKGFFFDDAAWKQLTRMVPKYGVYGEATNVRTWNEYVNVSEADATNNTLLRQLPEMGKTIRARQGGKDEAGNITISPGRA